MPCWENLFSQCSVILSSLRKESKHKIFGSSSAQRLQAAAYRFVSSFSAPDTFPAEQAENSENSDVVFRNRKALSAADSFRPDSAVLTLMKRLRPAVQPCLSLLPFLYYRVFYRIFVFYISFIPLPIRRVQPVCECGGYGWLRWRTVWSGRC